MFYVGQKVVCIHSGFMPGISLPDEEQFSDEEAIHEGQIYTIRRILIDEEDDMIFHLEEVFRDESSREWYGDDAGYCARRFRPLVENKTDISIFKKMLNPDNHNEKIDA